MPLINGHADISSKAREVCILARALIFIHVSFVRAAKGQTRPSDAISTEKSLTGPFNLFQPSRQKVSKRSFEILFKLL